MKKTLKYILLLIAIVSVWMGCKRDSDFILSTPSAYISNFDLKKLYKGGDLLLNAELMGGATSIKGVVISDFRSGNSPAGLLILQNSRMAGNGIDSLRGMAFNIGADASKYIPGDSVHINVNGATLKRIDGILQIVGVANESVTKIAGGKTLKTQAINTGRILANPDMYESTLVTISSALYEPEPAPGTTYAGDKIINDGFGKATVHTEATASFASTAVLPTGNFTGIPFITGSGASTKINLWLRSLDDFFFVVLPKLSPAIITGYLVDPNGGDQNNEYIQFLATKDINFATTPFAVYTTNNAGATVFPLQGWNTGGVRTYKFNLTSGTVSKGQYFYVGGSAKRINGSPTQASPNTPYSTDISSAKWIAGVDYSVETGVVGADGIGAKTNNLLANSGNIAGIAIFEGTNVTINSVPLDVIFWGGTGGNFYSAGPPEVGYRITNTDYYSTINPLTRLPQNFMGAGTNTSRLGFPTATSFAKLGGVYDATSGRWVTGRTLTSVPLTLTSQLSQIEGGTSLVN
ncbi:hypothetical protein HDC92_001854 [Pedobacter sp. AK017]|uniref:DUF5689 domain-containing protein n=1 Tax=Pedobacter sp. AK017 TaxID=2723073 RepID=UPI0017F3C2A5|nr:DUF5689 domain-containing protein [Pedobacter sp. AK017]MBB5438179.1 hypothetical protein [Pedobacter sp. AK017]